MLLRSQERKGRERDSLLQQQPRKLVRFLPRPKKLSLVGELDMKDPRAPSMYFEACQEGRRGIETVAEVE